MKLFLTALCLLLFCSLAAADIIKLKNGAVITANIANETENNIFVIYGNEWKEIPRDEIASIEPEKRPRGLTETLFDNNNVPAENIKMNELIFKLGYDFFGRLKTSTDNYVADNSISAAFEYFHYFNAYIAAGLGAAAQAPRYAEDVSGRFGFAPVYLALKVRSLPQKPYMYGYAVGHIGYNAFYGTDSFKNTSGALYYAAGFGVVIEKFLFELLYGVNGNTEADYSKLTFSIGVAL